MVQTRAQAKRLGKMLYQSGKKTLKTVRQYGSKSGPKAVDREIRQLVNTAQNVIANLGSSGSGSSRNPYGSPIPLYRPPRAARPAPSTPHGGVRSRRKRWGSSTAKYVGKFPSKPKRGKEGKVTQSLKQGYHLTAETYGTVTDPHCAYVGHNTMDYTIAKRAISGAIHRKLLMKAGISCESKNVELPLIATGASGPSAFLIIMIFINNVTGAIQDLLYEIPDDIDLQGLVNGNTTLLEYIEGYLTGQFALQDDVLKEIRLYERVANLPIDERRLRSRMDMTKEKLHVIVKSQLRIQNRTKGDVPNNDDLSADRVDNVPVDGKLYTFKHAHAKLASKTPNPNLMVRFNSMPTNGIVLARGSGMSFTEELAEPPNPAIFTNCIGASKVFLNPGDIKDCKITNFYSGKFDTLMNKLRAKYSTGIIGGPNPPPFSYGVPGKMQLVVLEEMIRSISSNEIHLVYERNLEIGAWLTSTHPKYALTTELVVDTDNDINPPPP